MRKKNYPVNGARTAEDFAQGRSAPQKGGILEILNPRPGSASGTGNPEPEPERQKEKLIQEKKDMEIFSIAVPIFLGILHSAYRVGVRLAVLESKAKFLESEIEDLQKYRNL
jgi:hypothetical protein